MTAQIASSVYVEDTADRDFAAAIFDALRALTSDGEGITRLAYSELESAALDLVEAEARQLGFATERDAGANLIITLEGRDPSLPFLACGSHLDSVPQGGNFDGAAGVIAGLTVLAHFKREGFRPQRTIKIYALRGEESARFGRAYMGSSALFGKLSAADLASVDGNGETLARAMASVGIDMAPIEKGDRLLDPARIFAWLELHIEQGPVLVARKLPVGIVTGIRGNIRHAKVECLGEAGHSGAVPRWLRRDALFAVAELITHLDRHWRTMLERGRDLVITCGVIGTDPKTHALARIPEKVQFSFEVRSQSQETLEAFYDLFLSECALVSEERGVEFKLDRRIDSAPAILDQGWIKRLEKAAHELGLPCEDIPSGAGHDAAVFANVGIPAAMLFVRNEHGSHNPKEAMTIDDFIAGVSVLRTAIKDALE